MARRVSARVLVFCLVFLAASIARGDHFCSAPPPTGSAIIEQTTSGTSVVRVEHQNTGRIEVYLGDSMFEVIEFPGQSWTSKPLPIICVTDPVPVRVVLVNCLGYSADKQHRLELSAGVLAPLDHNPTVSVIAADGSSSVNTVRVRWTLKNGSTGRLNAKLTEMDGTITPLATDFGIAGESGEAVWNFSAGPGTVSATVTSCNGLYEASDAAPVLQRACTDCNNNCDVNCAGHPIRTSNGNARFTETDPIPGADFLPFRRIYDSRVLAPGAFGAGWTSIFDGRLVVIPVGSDAAGMVAVTTDAGVDYVFRRVGSIYEQIAPSPGNEPAQLVSQNATDWLLTENAGQLGRIYSNGRIKTYIDRRTGREVTIGYDAAGDPASVSDSFTQYSWSITYSTIYKVITQVVANTSPATTWTYLYGNGRLTGVVSPLGTWRTYEYMNSGGRYAISIVRDASNHVVESHAFDGVRALDSYGPGEDIASIDYGLAGRVADEQKTVYHWTTGKTETHYLRPIGGEMRTVEISGGCASCGSRDRVYVYDAATGNTTREQDSRGFVQETTYFGDGRIEKRRTNLRPSGCDPQVSATLCRQTPDELATVALVTTPPSVTTSYTYDTTWKQKPATITTTSVISGNRVESFTYDATTGDVATHSVSGSTGIPATTQTRTTVTTRYNGAEGAAFAPGGSVFTSTWTTLAQPPFRKAVNGPRPDPAPNDPNDVSDVTQYVYYPIDAAVPALLRGRLAAVKNALGHITRFEDYDAFGNATRVVDPNGVASESVHDALGRLVTSKLIGDPACDTAIDPLCATDIIATRSYTGAGPLDFETAATGGVTKYEYDSESRVHALSRGPSLTDLRERVETDYDPATGKVWQERTFAKDGSSWILKKSQTNTYNSLGELVTVTHGDNNSVGYTYDAGGQIATTRDENHASANTAYVYDEAGRLKRVEQTLATAPSGKAVTSYAYDRAGNLTSVTDPNGNVTTYLYDDFGQLLRQTSPVTGVMNYGYDAAGNLTSITDASNATTSRSYDALGRIRSAVSTRAGLTETIAWTYDAGAFGLGRMATMTDPTGSTTYLYNRRGQLRQETKVIAGTSYVTGYQYDAMGNRAKIIYPSGGVVTFTHDYASRPKTAAAGTTPLVTDTEYLPFGPMTKIVYGNGTTKQMAFDNRYRPTTNQLTSATQTLASYVYGHDAAGNITSIQDDLDPAYNRSFQYDDLNRLTVANSGASLWGNGAYTYDAMGNLLTSSVGNRSLTAYPNAPNPRYTGVTENGVTRQISYDAAGNERVVGSETFEYNARNQLASSGALSYRYDGRGVRSVTTVQGGCPLSVQRAPSSFSAAGGTGRIEVTALPGCTWSASTNASWLTLGAPSGNALSFTAAANATISARTATVTVGELSFTITQAGSNGRSNGGFDLDGNGGAELVAYGSRTGDVVVRTTNGLAAGAPATVETVADLWWKVVGSGDFDGDGDSDLLWRHGWSGEVAVHRMQNGTLDGVTSLYTEADRAWRIAAVGDVNGDGKADIISRNAATGAVVERLMATGMTVSPQTALLTEADPAWRLVAAGDFNGDSLADLLWRNGRSGEVQVQFRSGSTFGVRTTAFTRADLAWVIAGVGDLDLDGKADIVMHDLRYGGLEIAYRQGAAVTTLLRTEPDPLWTVAQMADYDGNGMADVLWRNSRSGALRTDLLNGPAIVVSSSLLSSSDRALRFPNAVRASLVRAAPAADTLGDGRSDVIWRNTTNGDVAVWQMNGATVPANEVILNVAAPGWEVRAAGDLNRDGTADLVWRNAGAGSVAFWYLNGKNLIGSDYLFLNDPVQKDWSVEAAGDLSGDGETDLIFRNVVTGTVRIMESLTPTPSHWNRDEYDISVGDLNWRLAGVGDFNGDRRTDLLWWHRTTGQLSMWLMTKGGIAEAKVIYAVAPEWRPLRVGDFSADGRADVLWRSFTTGAYSLWEMNGMTIAASAALPAPNNDLYYNPQATSGDYNGDGYEDMLLRHSNGDVGTWEMASPANPTFRSFGNVATDWVVQRLEPRPHSTSGSSIAALSNDQTSQPAWTAIDAPPFWSVSPVRQVRVPRTTGPPFWAPAKGVTGPVPTPPIIPPGLGSSTTTPIADADSFDASPSAGPALIGTNAVTTSTRHSLYTPELTLLAETELTTGTPALAYEYIWFAGQPLAQIDLATSTIAYTFTDHLGTPLLQTDSAANVIWRVEYEPYGRVHTFRAGASRHQPLRFPGQEFDALAPERAYNVFRWYRDGWGRYTQADPIGLRGGLNQYAYTFDNPIRWTDPTGTCVCAFKGNIGRLTIAGNCKGKLPIWIIDEKGGPAAGAVAGTTVSADGFVLGGILHKIDGSVCVEIDCSGSGFAMSTCVNNIACFLGKKEPYPVPWGTFGGPPKEPPSGAYPPVAK